MGKIGYKVFVEVYKKDKEQNKYINVFSYCKEGQSFTWNLTRYLWALHRKEFFFLDRTNSPVGGYWYGVSEITEAEYVEIISVLADSEIDNYGIIIGKSDKDFSVRDYWLGDQYHNSVFKHSDMVIELEDDTRIEYSRKFENITASTQVVKEIGLAAKVKTDQNTYYVLLARDTIVPINVEPNALLVVKYRIQCE